MPDSTPQPFTLRDAAPADLPTIVDIYNASIPGRLANADYHPVTVESRRAWFEAHSPDRRPLWVAEQEGEVIAWIGLADLFPRPAYHITAELSLYVAPAHQGKRLGVALLQQMLDRCPAIGVENIVSIIYAHNEPSLKLHERFGFTKWGHLPGVTEMDGRRLDVVILGKKIAPES